MTPFKYPMIRVVILLTALVSWGTGVSVQAQPTSEQRKNPYPQEVTEAYLEACLQNSVAQGLTEQQSESLCTCTLNQFKIRYTFEEFIQVYAEANESNEPPAAIFEIGSVCARTLVE